MNVNKPMQKISDRKPAHYCSNCKREHAFNGPKMENGVIVHKCQYCGFERYDTPVARLP